MINIIIVDDESAVRKGLRLRLAAEPDIAIVGSVADGESAVSLARLLHPDVVLMDIGLPDMGGCAAARRVLAVSPSSAIIALTMHDDTATRECAQAAGMVGFITKHIDIQELLTAIRSTHNRKFSTSS